MADHLNAPGLTSPMSDARTDITDVYAFQKAGDTSKSILVLNVNPLAPTLASFFNSEAIYMINVDTDRDAVADRSFRIRFSEVVGGAAQTATVHLATGALAARLNDGGPVVIAGAPASFGSQPNITTHGDYRFFAGLRSDPFFFDLFGFINNLHFTGSDFFVDKNVFGIVLEVPNTALGTSPDKTSIWGRTLLSENGSLVRDDRMARAAINTVFNHKEDKNIFNSIDPDQDLDPTVLTTAGITFLQSFTNTLEALGLYTQAQADGIARILLPDVLNYDFTNATDYKKLNGRALTDDVIDFSLSLVTNGGVPSDGVEPHSDYLTDFPYLGQPH